MGRPKTTTTNTNTNKSLTATNLQNLLWETANAVRNEVIDPTDANSIAMQSREICRVERIKMEYAKMTGKAPTKKDMVLLG